MKKVMKRVITACLAFAMILALVTPASVEAATKNESLNLYLVSYRCEIFK